MNDPFEIEVNISSGKKSFKVINENDAYTLLESGSIAAVIKRHGDRWHLTTGSYNEEDAQTIGSLIEQNIRK